MAYLAAIRQTTTVYFLPYTSSLACLCVKEALSINCWQYCWCCYQMHDEGRLWWRQQALFSIWVLDWLPQLSKVIEHADVSITLQKSFTEPSD
jgi:hypothetical protein